MGRRDRVMLESIPARAGEPLFAWREYGFVRVYPRACGGTYTTSAALTAPSGLSPRVRGNLYRLPTVTRHPRSIPARAGEPSPPWPTMPLRQVYPRACGGTHIRGMTEVGFKGLSPRVRGNQTVISLSWKGSRSIPARAGEPSEYLDHLITVTVYPRACGGTPSDPACLPALLGSIPARAGEPEFAVMNRKTSEVYPRACGGTAPTRTLTLPIAGLSPRVRGNQGRQDQSRLRRRSIPARAGEPIKPGSAAITISVYPRACGGTMLSYALMITLMGLSPRVRGNQAQLSHSYVDARSIPARAGEPLEQ